MKASRHTDEGRYLQQATAMLSPSASGPLALPRTQINPGEVVELLENSLEVVDCEAQQCSIMPACKLKGILNEATSAFVKTLKNYTLADLVDAPKNELIQILNIG